ncbi:MAG TPA: bifunctional demethylmenaquinone methyltransferase/2-methoxy-6-polyprenyl-1,4-benzoquinol methylase UbiE [Gammaproteobacteria bacterium]|nr:bifunctional demethylmenaquinone methyltransferase/2-methoxy-6-polyprenyl-1,4-benzoquinol methylase UbiE [Gammaproteobacteria bacterium]
MSGKTSDRTDTDTTHFGFQQVPVPEKKRRVGQVFDSVAERYDIMNDVMSFGIHRLWKWLAIHLSHVRPGQRVLDLAAGSGDLSRRLARRVGEHGEVVAADINAAMLERGRQRLTDEGLVGNIRYVQADAERLPFPDAHFHHATMAFGLRNVTDKAAALAELRRVLKPGGQLLILEFSRPRLPLLSRAYDFYSFNVLPRMGQLIVNDADSYRYLAESIRIHPDQETLLAMMQEAGLEQCDYLNFSAGIVALHRGRRL